MPKVTFHHHKGFQDFLFTCFMHVTTTVECLRGGLDRDSTIEAHDDIEAALDLQTTAIAWSTGSYPLTITFQDTQAKILSEILENAELHAHEAFLQPETHEFYTGISPIIKD